MKSDALISHLAEQMIAEYGFDAERAAIELADLMLDLGERERQAECLRVRMAIVTLCGQSATAVVPGVP